MSNAFGFGAVDVHTAILNLAREKFSREVQKLVLLHRQGLPLDRLSTEATKAFLVWGILERDQKNDRRLKVGSVYERKVRDLTVCGLDQPIRQQPTPPPEIRIDFVA